MTSYTLSIVKTKGDAKKFNQLPFELYKEDSNWIAPFTSEIEEVFDPKKNIMFENGAAQRWLLYKGDKVVGRIAAFYTTEQSVEDKQPTGGCGFFECIDCQQAANMLFDCAKEYLIANGMQAMDGPINFGTRDKFWGLLVEGYYAPIYGMNYNHKYYQALFEGYGFKNYFNQHSYYMSMDGQRVAPQVAQRYQRLMDTGEYEFRHIEKSDYEWLPIKFVDIYNSAWGNFTGVKTMTHKEGKELFKKLKPIIENRLIMIALHKGEMIGFFIMIPDINGALRYLGGKSSLFAKLKLLYHLKIRKSCDVIIGLIFGVDPRYQGKGVESGMIEGFKRVILSENHHYRHMELAWIGDFNPLMMRMAEKYVGASPYKVHTTFRYMFDRTIPFERAPRVSVSRRKEQELDAKQN